MKRRNFIKRTTTAGLVTLVTPTTIVHALRHTAENTLEQSFKNPPAIARPYTWWHWMNGNITKEGITLDLEAMKRVGIGGVQCFNVGSGIPKGPVDYLSPGWVELNKHAIREAGRLGLEFDMHNCPGWSSTGGPWITPELSMQQVVWSETIVAGGKEVETILPKPFAKLDFYRDTYVVAFPALKGEQQSLQTPAPKVSTAAGAVDIALLNSDDFSKGVEVKPVNDQPGFLLFEFPQPFEARSLTLFSTTLPGPSVTGATQNQPGLEASDDGIQFRKVGDVRRTGNNVEMPAAVSFPAVKAKYFRLLLPQPLLIAGFRLSTDDRIINWPTKANFPGAGGAAGAQNTSVSSPLSSDINSDSVINPSSVIDLSKLMDKEGRLKWKAPAGEWTVLRFGHTAIGRKNNAPPESGAGLECDKYSRTAYDFHFKKMFENLLPVLKETAAKTKAGLLIDSYEVGLQNWTVELPQEFQKRRGYDVTNYLPAFTGRIVGSVDITERFLWDLRKTCADLMADNYHGYLAELCKKHGLLAYTEPYNNGPFEQMEVGSRMDVNMGEFWIRGPHFHPSVKLAASIAHIYGQRIGDRQIVGAESFTGDAVHSKWQEHPYAMKAHGDLMYTKGLNRFIFHRYAHQPHPTARPGMTMGPWGFHFDRTNTWFEKSRPWLDYAARCQSVLQQGVFAGDLLYFTGEDTPGDDFSMMFAPDPAPPEGYDYDFIDKKALLHRLRIKNGALFLPDDTSYRVLILPGKKTVTLDVLRKLHELVKGGMILVGPSPLQTPGLANSEANDAALKGLVQEIWGDGNNTAIVDRRVGQGRVFQNVALQTVLERLNISPDFAYTSHSGDAAINCIHRKLNDADVYFVANRKRSREETVVSFRMTGKKPELWNADTGEITPVAVYEITNGRTSLALPFEPAGSYFVVFRSPATATTIKAIEKDGKAVLSTTPFTAPAPGRHASVTNNFTIAVWVKPETEENFSSSFALGRGIASNVFYPPEGEAVYGQNHAACGLVAARNGLMMYERTAGTPINMQAVPVPLSGWTHVALVYRDGTPLLYVNGKLTKEGTSSGKIVHPGLGEEYQDRLSWFFEGEKTAPELFAEVLTEQRLQQLAGKGLPQPATPFPVQPATVAKGGLLFWQDGLYILRNNRGQSIKKQIAGAGKIADLSNGWDVLFPPDSGAPARIQLPQLASLHKHPEDGVKYFSGTAAYTKRLTVPATALSGNKRLYLDLGRVEVIAEVKLNGKDLGMLWKPPYQVDITNLAKGGEIFLEIQVTNLWPNRLIGDEQLPAENEYGNAASPGGAIRKLPDWYVEGKPKPAGGRTTFTTWRHYFKESPLLESGLLGPVCLYSCIYQEIPL